MFATLPAVVVKATRDCRDHVNCRVRVEGDPIRTPEPVFTSDGVQLAEDVPVTEIGRIVCDRCEARWQYEVSSYILSVKPISQRRDESA